MMDILFLRRWWMWQPRDDSLPSQVYHAFNLLEGFAWLIFSALVLARYAWHRRSPLELAYAAAFCTFGLSDFREAWALDSWLIWFKLANLILLLWLRRTILRRWYPTSTLY